MRWRRRCRGRSTRSRWLSPPRPGGQRARCPERRHLRPRRQRRARAPGRRRRAGSAPRAAVSRSRSNPLCRRRAPGAPSGSRTRTRPLYRRLDSRRRSASCLSSPRGARSACSSSCYRQAARGPRAAPLRRDRSAPGRDPPRSPPARARALDAAPDRTAPGAHGGTLGCAHGRGCRRGLPRARGGGAGSRRVRDRRPGERVTAWT